MTNSREIGSLSQRRKNALGGIIGETPTTRIPTFTAMEQKPLVKECVVEVTTSAIISTNKDLSRFFRRKT